MSFHIDFSQQAVNDIESHKKTGNKAVLRKLLKILNELSEHPIEGTGKPERLKYNYSGLWSRRINSEHRLVYDVQKNKIIVLSAKGHYQ